MISEAQTDQTDLAGDLSEPELEMEPLRSCDKLELNRSGTCSLRAQSGNQKINPSFARLSMLKSLPGVDYQK